MTVRDMLGAAGGSDGSLYVDDVFSAFTYTGNGATQTINNGIDLAGKGGLVWLKHRTGSPANQNHNLVDTLRGTNKPLYTNTTGAELTQDTIESFNSDGFSLGAFGPNAGPVPYASWTFRKAPKFFDVVTYTGNGVDGRVLTHNFGSAVGMVIVKNTSNSANWNVWHKNTPSNLCLNSAAAEASTDATYTGVCRSVTDTTMTFYAGGGGVASVNQNGQTYVAYLFAHDTSADGIVQCGSFTTDGGGNATVNLGWEPQYVLIKKTNAAEVWYLFDEARGFTVAGNSDEFLLANTSAASAGSASWISKSATGFAASDNAWGAAQTYIYLAIRRPNKPPTTGTQVYNAIARTGTGAAATVTGVGFAPDWVLSRRRNGHSPFEQARLRGQTYLQMNAETIDIASSATIVSYDMDGITVGSDLDFNGPQLIQHFFKRAPGVFDVVCWTGDGLTNLIPHSLGVKPELVIFKQRNSTSNWEVGVLTSTTDYALRLNMTNAADSGATNTISVGTTASVFSSTLYTPFYSTGNAFIAYLFATKLGISKVGSYTGNGSTQTIDCGFTTGARFVLIKRTDSTGDWYVWDSTRGIVAGNDPHLSLNTYFAEVTSDDSIDPDSTGFIVNQVSATNINVSAATYIYLAIA